MYNRCILNSILYIDSRDANLVFEKSEVSAIVEKSESVASRLKKKKMIKGARNLTELDGTIVGSSIRQIILKRGVSESEIRSGAGDKITKRFMVRGHYREQPFGENRSERKPIWIKPFYKGPEFAEVINRPYLVK